MERYAFSKEIKLEINKLCKLNNIHGAVSLLYDYIVIVAAILLSKYNSYFYPITLFLIGSRQRAFATILHEAAHCTLAKNRKLNYFLGTYLSGYLIFQMWETYKTSHVRWHHHKLGEKDKDPDYTYYLASGVYKDCSQYVFIWNNLIKPALFLNSFSSFKYLIKNRLFSKESRKELMPMFISILVFSSIGSIIFGYEFFILYWLIPYITVFQMLTWFIELAEHYPMISTAKKNIYATRNRFSHPVEHFFTGMHNENFHLVHHLFPGVPFWKLKKAHQILLRDEVYLKVNSEFGGIFISSNYVSPMWQGLLLNMEYKCKN